MKGGQEVQQNLVMVFLKKNSSGQMGQFGQKNDGYKSVSPLRIFFCEFCTIKEGKKHIEITLMVFPEKNLFRAIGSFWDQKMSCHILIF